jgi:hypothetical protein
LDIQVNSHTSSHQIPMDHWTKQIKMTTL